MALAQYREKFWFPNGAIAAHVTARIFLEDDNVFAALYTDDTGATPLPNPTATSADGFLEFWAEEGVYWLHIDTEAFRITVGDSNETFATEGYVLARIADHNSDTTNVHGIPDTADLLTEADLDGYATEAQLTAVADDLAAHEAATTNVHGIADTAELETQAGAQAKADAAQAAAEATAAATYLPLTGGTVTGPLQVDDDLTVTGELAVTGDSVGMGRGVYKQADQSRASTTTLQADSELALPVAAGGIYLLVMFVHATADPAADINMDFTFPTGSDFVWTESGVSLGNSNNIGSINYNPNTGTTASTVGILATGTAFTPSGTLRVGGTSGTLAFRWAQAASSATPTVVKAGSVMTLLRIA